MNALQCFISKAFAVAKVFRPFWLTFAMSIFFFNLGMKEITLKGGFIPFRSKPFSKTVLSLFLTRTSLC